MCKNKKTLRLARFGELAQGFLLCYFVVGCVSAVVEVFVEVVAGEYGVEVFMEQAAYGLVGVVAVVKEVAFCVDDEVAVDEAVFDDAAGMGIVLYEVVEFFVGDGYVVVAESAIVEGFHFEQFPAVDFQSVQVVADLFVEVELVDDGVDFYQ